MASPLDSLKAEETAITARIATAAADPAQLALLKHQFGERLGHLATRITALSKSAAPGAASVETAAAALEAAVAASAAS